MFLETTVLQYIYWNTYMKFIDGFLLQTRQKDASCYSFLRASMLGTIDGFLSVMLCYSKYGATGIKGTRRTPSVVLSTWQLSYYVDTCGVWVTVHET